MSGTQKKILYIFDHADWQSRLPVATEAQKRGYDVTIGIVGALADDIAASDLGLRFTVLTIPKPKNKFGPLSIIGTIRGIQKAVQDAAPDLLHTVTLKYSFLVGLACLFQKRCAIVYTIAGLGFLFRSEGWKPKVLRLALSPLLKMVLRNKTAQIIIQNPDDRDLLLEKGYIRKSHAHLVISSGVDLEKFTAMQSAQNNPPMVLMVTRLVYEKGVHIFADAAQALTEAGYKARFCIAGGLTTHNPKAITQGEMDSIVAQSGIQWLGRVENVPALLAQADIFVYPSYYGEGVPRVTIEAIASAKPVVTTDHPGCKEPVENGRNGFLVPIKDSIATQQAIETLLKDPDLRHKMGQESRKIAIERFDMRHIIDQTLSVYDQALIMTAP